MKIRKNILPRRLVDVLCFLLISISLPIVFIFEMIVVLPAVHEPGGVLHTFTFVIAIFIVFNIKANMIACMMIDTSVDYDNLKIPLNAESTGWQYCKNCKKMGPPRSWHCKDCKTCILKRDHHCLFMGCCVGHKNHRYFVMFIIFLFIGATYAFVYNSYYLWVLKARVYKNRLSLFKMLCPVLMLFHGSTWHNLYLVMYNLNILALVYAVVLLIFHGPAIIRGGVCYERNKGYIYDMGFARNMEAIFGKRKHLAWLSPLIKSELPDDGVIWNKFLNHKNKCEKAKQ